MERALVCHKHDGDDSANTEDLAWLQLLFMYFCMSVIFLLGCFVFKIKNNKTMLLQYSYQSS